MNILLESICLLALYRNDIVLLSKKKKNETKKEMTLSLKESTSIFSTSCSAQEDFGNKMKKPRLGPKPKD